MATDIEKSVRGMTGNIVQGLLVGGMLLLALLVAQHIRRNHFTTR